MVLSRVSIILRVGLAFAFLYPPFNAALQPDAWIGYFPSFMHGVVPDAVLLRCFGVVEVIIALWLLSGWKVFYPAVIATLMLLCIVVFNLPEFQVVFRDLSIAAMGVALAVLHLPSRKPTV